jgi:hypothetical protein
MQLAGDMERLRDIRALSWSGPADSDGELSLSALAQNTLGSLYLSRLGQPWRTQHLAQAITSLVEARGFFAAHPLDPTSATPATLPRIATTNPLAPFDRGFLAKVLHRTARNVLQARIAMSLYRLHLTGKPYPDTLPSRDIPVPTWVRYQRHGAGFSLGVDATHEEKGRTAMLTWDFPR